MLKEEPKLRVEKVWTINGDDKGKECWIKMLYFYCKVEPEHRKEGYPYNRRKKNILFPFNIFKFHLMNTNYYSTRFTLGTIKLFNEYRYEACCMPTLSSKLIMEESQRSILQIKKKKKHMNQLRLKI